MTTIEKTPITPFQFLEDERVRVQDEEVSEQSQEVDPVDEALEAERSVQDERPERQELEYDVQIAGNPIKIIAEDWRSKGYLPDDFEVPEDITEEQLEQVYRTYKESLIEADVRERLTEELRQNGVDGEILETARMIKYGVPQQEISRADAYQALGTAQLDPNDENYEVYARQILGQFYSDKGFAPDKIQKYIDRDLEDDDVESIVADAQGHFRATAQNMRQYFKQLEHQKQLEERQRVMSTIQQMDSYLKRGELAGRKYTPQQMETVRRALFDKTEVVVDAQGNRHRITAYEKKRLEYQNNFELNLKSVVDFILGYDAKAVEEEGKLKGRSETLRELNKAVQVTIKGVREMDGRGIERKQIS